MRVLQTIDFNRMQNSLAKRFSPFAADQKE